MRFVFILLFGFIITVNAQNPSIQKLNIPYLVIEFTSIQPTARQLESIKSINSQQSGIIESIYCPNNNILYYHFDLNNIQFTYPEEFLKNFHDILKDTSYKIHNEVVANEIHEKFHHSAANIDKIILK